MGFRKVAAMFLLTAGLAGCVTEGKDFRSNMSWIKSGQTKKDDVRMMLGVPYSVGEAAGKPTWTYGYYRYKLIGKSHQKELKLYWDPNGTVSSFAFTSSFPEDTRAVGGAPAAPAAAAAPVKGSQPQY